MGNIYIFSQYLESNSSTAFVHQASVQTQSSLENSSHTELIIQDAVVETDL